MARKASRLGRLFTRERLAIEIKPDDPLVPTGRLIHVFDVATNQEWEGVVVETRAAGAVVARDTVTRQDRLALAVPTGRLIHVFDVATNQEWEGVVVETRAAGAVVARDTVTRQGKSVLAGTYWFVGDDDNE